ncbi:MAG: hypothetical protein JW936_05765 [Sedimentisphaerales bacterium]|nr:hypothetical protein [Sedimentisphaerales bacterium]
MKKKLLLVTISMLAVLLVLFIYWQIRGDDQSVSRSQSDIPLMSPTGDSQQPGTTPLDAGPVQVGEIQRPHFIARDEQGNIVREFGFEQRLGTEQDRLSISQPWMILYQNGQIIEMNADYGQIPVQSAAGQVQIPPTGLLQGDVTIQINRPNPDQPDAPSRSQLLITLDQLHFDMEASELTATGPVSVLSPRFTMAGQDLNFKYDQLANRLQRLQIRRVQLLRIRADQLFAEPTAPTVNTTQPQTPQSTTTDTPTTAAQTQTLPSTPDIITYRAKLHNNVVIDRADEQLTANDNVEIVIALDNTAISQSAVDTATPSTTAVTPAANAPIDPNSSAAPQWITITFSGPLEIYTEDSAETTPDQMQLIARGTPDAPARLTRAGQDIVVADTIEYNRQTQRIEFSARLTDPNQPLDQQQQLNPVFVQLDPQSQIVAQNSISFDQASGLVAIVGPGNFSLQSAQQTSAVTGQYQGSINIQLDPCAPSDQNLVGVAGRRPRQIDFLAPIAIQTPDQNLQASQGRITFLPTTTYDPCVAIADTIQTIELHDPNMHSPTQQQQFHSQYLIAQFVPDNTGRTTLQTITADGDIYAQDPNYIFQASQSLLLTFAPPAPAIQTPDTPETPASPDTIAAAFADTQLQHVSALGSDNTVILIDRRRNYQVQGHQLEADVTTGLWQIYGEPASIQGIAEGQLLQGPLITLDQMTQECTIEGSGNISVMTQTALDGQPLPQPTPVNIAWQDGATYNIAQHNVTLNAVTLNSESADMLTHQTYQMTCSILDVELQPNEPCQPAAPSADTTSIFSQQSNIKVLSAQGPDLQLTSQTTDAVTNQPIRHMQLNGQALRFNQLTGILQIRGPGTVEILDYRPATPTPNTQTEPQTTASVDTVLNNAFANQGPNYNLARFSEWLTYDRDASQLTFTSQVSLDHLPLTSNSIPTAAQALNVEGMTRLDCRTLQITLDETDNQPDQPNAPASLNTTRISHLLAQDEVFLEIVNQGRHHIFVAESAAYDSTLQTIYFQGSERLPVNFDQMRFLNVNYNLTTGNFEAVPFGTSQISP